MKKILIIIITILILAGMGYVAYWYIYVKPISTTNTTDIEGSNGFKPYARNNVNNPTPTKNVVSSSTNTNNSPYSYRPPKLRQLSIYPVAGLYASTTKIKSQALASTTIEKTIVRFMDRGTGYIFEASDLSNNIEKISNTTLPRIYEAYFNKNLNAIILRYLRENTDDLVNIYAEIRPTATTSTSTTPFEIKASYLSSKINQIAVSPNVDKVFSLEIDGGRGMGYISDFNGRNRTKLLDTPLTQLNIDWPATNTLLITSRSSSLIPGFSYSINTKTGDMTKLIGELRGLYTNMSRDGKYLLFSNANKSIKLRLFNTKTSSSTDIMFNTLADKCVWSNLRKTEAYCAVPNNIPDGNYPEDWYKGKTSFMDKIWHIDISTGEVHMMADLSMITGKSIDAMQLFLDPKENYLFFIDKNDLTPWMLDLNQ